MPDSLNPFDTERTRAIITPADRRYLLGDHDVEPQSQRERVIRGRIRERVRQALLDFTLLFRHLEDRDLHAIFDEEDLDPDRLPTTTDEPISLGAAHAVALFYRDDPDSMEGFLENAIRFDLRERGWLADPEVRIRENRQMSAEAVLQRVKETGEVWPEEKNLLERQGLVRPTEWTGLTEHHTGSRDDGIPDGVTSPEDGVEYLSLPASGGSEREEQRKAIGAAVDYIRRERDTTLEEIQEAVYPLYPGGFDDREAWLRDLLHPALTTLPGIEVLLRGRVILTDTSDGEGDDHIENLGVLPFDEDGDEREGDEVEDEGDDEQSGDE